MKRVLATLYILGLTMVMFALTMLIPLFIAYVGGDAARDAFRDGFLISVGIGGGLAALTRRNRSEL
ncbi:MAG: TrkH family potassium uptake protein, partial [Achromobacter mucicolens]